jgi:hypothetical protein
MVRAQSMTRIAGRASCMRCTGSFRAEPYEPQKPVGLEIVVCLGRAHIDCSPIACAQTAGGANVRLASVL